MPSAEPAFAEPVVALRGSGDPAVPLVVLLHGRGSHEQEIVALADHLPQGVAYAAVRAPIAEGGGYAWFANRGIGRPVAESLAATMGWFRTWLDEVAPPGRPVVLAGFSGGAAFAGGLVLADPARFAGAAILYGTLPFDAGVPVETARLTGLPVFVAQGEQDRVIPRELLDRTWAYLLGDSGAAPYARRDPGGHGVTAETLAELGGWLAERLTYLARHGAAPLTPAEAARDLASARTARRTLERFTASRPDLDEDWGLAVQDLDRAARQAAGERLTGAKLGLTSAPKQRTMGVHRPIVGFLTDAMDLGRAGFDVAALAQPRVEPEVAFVLGADLDRPLGRDEVPGVVASVCAALEVLDSRWTGYRFGLADVLADNTSAAGYLLGEPAALPDDLASREARFLVDGRLVARTTPAAILGDPLLALVHLSHHLARRGETLPAGSVVLAGAMTDAVPLAAGTTVTAAIDGLPPLTLDLR